MVSIGVQPEHLRFRTVLLDDALDVGSSHAAMSRSLPTLQPKLQAPASLSGPRRRLTGRLPVLASEWHTAAASRRPRAGDKLTCHGRRRDSETPASRMFKFLHDRKRAHAQPKAATLGPQPQAGCGGAAPAAGGRRPLRLLQGAPTRWARGFNVKSPNSEAEPTPPSGWAPARGCPAEAY